MASSRADGGGEVRDHLDADRRPAEAGLDDVGARESTAAGRAVPRRRCAAAPAAAPAARRRGHAGEGQLVHAQGGAGHAGPGVGDAGEVERRLERAVLAGPPWQQLPPRRAAAVGCGPGARRRPRTRPLGPGDEPQRCAPRGTPSTKSAASSVASTSYHSPVLDQYRPHVAPGAGQLRAACRPVRMLTSCSGDGPPKMTATWRWDVQRSCSRVGGRWTPHGRRGPAALKGSGRAGRSRTARRPRPEVLPHPLARLRARRSPPPPAGGPRSARRAGPGEQGAAVGAPHHHQVGGHGGAVGGEAGVLLALQRARARPSPA